MDRRTLLRGAASTAALTGLAGCLGGVERAISGGDDDAGPDVAPEFPEIEEPPSAVYVPTHREAMRVLEPIEAGEYTLAPMLSYPHPFWLVDGRSTERVDPISGHGVHMMFTLWDAETGIVLPMDAGAEIRVERDGERVGSPRQPWPMLSQGMGFHFGDNVPLDDFGTYTVAVTLPPLPVERSGDFEDRFTESATATFEFTYDEAFLEDVVDGVEYLDEDLWGRRGALEPMHHGGDDHAGDDHEGDGHDHGDGGDGHDHEGSGHGGHADVPYSSLPPAAAYPGTLLEPADGATVVNDHGQDASGDEGGLPVSGDAAVLATLLEPGSRLAAGEARHLLVSPRTRYNRVPLADMALSVTVDRDGTLVEEGHPTQRLDHEFALHYGLDLEDVQVGDAVTISVETPPQVARHRGYETAFLEMEPVELVVPEVDR